MGINMLHTDDIRKLFSLKLSKEDFNDAGLLEIIGASFIANDESIFGEPDYSYINREIAWYNSKSRNINDMYNPPKIWRDIATDEGYINSNYGWCIYSKDNGNQYSNALQHLRDNINTRQATMIYNRPSMHKDSTADGMKDFMCTNAVTYEFRDGRLHCVVQMRSNDAIFGYKNDYSWQVHVLNKLARDLNVERGLIHWQVASLHIYPRHFKLIK